MADEPKQTDTIKQAKVIKRYANRKLYDTERSCYVTLEEISQMVKNGDDVIVVDNKTKDDLTAVTLAQIIVEEEKKVSKMPLKLLRSIIQSSEAIGDFYQKRVADPVTSLREDVERRVESLFRRDEKKADGEATDTEAQGSIGHRNLVQEFVSSSSDAFEHWQRRIDERVREAVAKISPKGPDIEALRARIEKLETRVKDFEARRGSEP